MAKLLIIDDELSMCDLLKNFFEMKDYIAFIATSGKEGLKVVKEKSPNIVLLDILMPGESGLDVLRQIKEINKEIKVIMMTAVKDQHAIDLAKQYGASDYITKPFSLKYLEQEAIPKLLKQLI